MNAETIMTLIIMSGVALVMVGLGVSQYRKKEEPVGFYNTADPPKKEEISDIIAWNKKHGMLWIAYGIIIELGYWLGYFAPNEVLEIIFSIGGVLIPIPFMIIGHHKLVKMYGKQR